MSVNEVIDKPYSKVTIELSENFKIDEIMQILSSMGDTQIDIIINNENKKVFYTLENKRNFDLKHYKALKGENTYQKLLFRVLIFFIVSVYQMFITHTVIRVIPYRSLIGITVVV